MVICKIYDLKSVKLTFYYLVFLRVHLEMQKMKKLQDF